MKFFSVLLVLLGCSPVKAQSVTDFYDYEAMMEARAVLAVSESLPAGERARVSAPAHETILRYQRRRSHPDSILTAALDLLNTAPKGSASYYLAWYSVGEAHLNSYDHLALQETLAAFTASVKMAEESARKHAEFYLMALRCQYELMVRHNYEKAVIYSLNALRQVDLDPSLHGILLANNTHILGKLGYYLGIVSNIKTLQRGLKHELRDDLDKISHELRVNEMYNALKKHRKTVNAQKKLIEKLKPYGNALPRLTAKAYLLMADAQYNYNRTEEVRSWIEKALSLYEYDGLPLYVATLYHLGHYDLTIAECQRVITRAVPTYHPTSVLDNPPTEAIPVLGANVDNILMWKARALYKKSIDADKETAVELLHASLATGEIGRKWNNRKLFAAEGYPVTQLIINRWNSYVLGYQMRAAYQLADRTKTPQDRKQAFRYMEMRKNFLLSDAFLSNDLPEDLQDMKRRNMEAIKKLEFKFWKQANDSTAYFKQAALGAIRELDETIGSIREQFPRRITDHAQLEYIDPDVIQASLDEETIYVMYGKQWQHWYAYVITAEKQRVVKLYEGFDMDRGVDKFLRLIKSPLQLQSSKREKLINQSHYYYNKLIKPFEAELRGKKKMVIVPERDICLLPFDLLLRTDDKKPYTELDFLINDYEITYQYSGTLYHKLRKRESVKNGSFLGFAPVFANGSVPLSADRGVERFEGEDYQGIHRDAFVPLPGTEREVAEIADMLPAQTNKTLLLNKQATGERLGAELKKPYQYVHIATHGLNNYYDPRLSAFACYTKDGSSSFYFANDIENLSIRADLAVLSSCESGVGLIVEGENLIALSRSFLASGTKNILYSLWKIDDAKSSQLMIDFYRQHLNGSSYATSLRAAKLKMLRNPETAAPRFWAPFVLMGE